MVKAEDSRPRGWDSKNNYLKAGEFSHRIQCSKQRHQPQAQISGMLANLMSSLGLGVSGVDSIGLVCGMH